ncbi:hypothetical protein CBOM_00509 [Ceraceosorus bombacis]|uniref:Uncharacterized protein n=1 Tax=Ceraceosorus bombacis TaxID=401625 RepID=A0A0P1B9Z0_9BASI|nr:hypothetical protein CBOM_00509 [Ceraceosorus bombacis]
MAIIAVMTLIMIRIVRVVVIAVVIVTVNMVVITIIWVISVVVVVEVVIRSVGVIVTIVVIVVIVAFVGPLVLRTPKDEPLDQKQPLEAIARLCDEGGDSRLPHKALKKLPILDVFSSTGHSIGKVHEQVPILCIVWRVLGDPFMGSEIGQEVVVNKDFVTAPQPHIPLMSAGKDVSA